MASPTEQFHLIDENVWTDDDGNVYENKAGKMQPTGGKVSPGPTPKAAIVARSEVPEGGIVELPRFSPAAIAAMLENQTQLAAVIANQMKDGYHYGKFGDWPKKRLLDPGASMILAGFRMYADPVRIVRDEEDDGGFRWTVTIAVKPMGFDAVIAMGVGAASTREIKYAYRWVEESDVPKDLDKDTLRQRGSNDGRTKFRIPNQDIGDLENTLLKMGTKRAEVDAVYHLPACSELDRLFNEPRAKT